MRLSQLLNDQCPESPCVAYAASTTEGDNSATTTILTYRAAQENLQQHVHWLRGQVESLAATNDTINVGTETVVIVAYLSSNTPDFMLSVLGCTDDAVAAVPALINTRWTSQEVTTVLQSDEKESSSQLFTLLLYGPGFGASAEKVVKSLQHRAVCLPIPTFAQEALVAQSPLSLVPAPSPATATMALSDRDIDKRVTRIASTQDAKQDAVLVFTSGTTSGSKGVRLSHAAVAVQAWAKLQAPCRYTAKTTMLATTVPFFHVGGLSSMVAVWLAGGILVFPATPSSAGFDPQQVWRSISPNARPNTSGGGVSVNVNTLVVVPAMLHALEQQHVATPTTTAAAGSTSTSSYPSVDLILIGGQSAPASTLAFLARIFPKARVVQTFACTEAASSLTFLNLTMGAPVLLSAGAATAASDANVQGDCVGVPPKHVQLSLFRVDQFGSKFVVDAPYTPGIIASRGPHVMNGYWTRQRHDQHATIGRNEWMFTNDLGFWDEQGNLYFSGRVNDVIRTGGETVLAPEVERVLAQHAAISECAVFALRDEKFGEAVCCALVCRDQRQLLQVADVRRWCQEQGLAGYKRPRRVFHVRELPRNSSGKILKFRLKERFESTPKLQSRL